MNKKHYLVLSGIVFCAFTSIGSLGAAPGIPQMVINESTSQCGWFNYGDEFVQVDLPSNWKTVTPEKNFILTTPLGVCDFPWDSMNNIQGYAENCCSELGLEYVNVSQIPFTQETYKHNDEDGYQCSIFSSSSNLGIAINQSTNQCSGSVGFRLTKRLYIEGYGNAQSSLGDHSHCQITDPNWIEYGYNSSSTASLRTNFVQAGEYRHTLSLEKGQLVWQENETWESLCTSLGYEFIDKVSGENARHTDWYYEWNDYNRTNIFQRFIEAIIRFFSFRG